MDTVTIYQDHAEEWRWRRQAANHEIIGDSGEGYLRKSAAVTMAEHVNGPESEDVHYVIEGD